MAQKVKCPCCNNYYDSRGFKVHVLFCCGGKAGVKLTKFVFNVLLKKTK